MTALPPTAPDWDLMLRGAVAGLLLFHVLQMALPGRRPATRTALALFALSLLAYLLCQRAGLLRALPAPLAWAVLALCASGTAWLWLAARSLFDDGFGLRPALLAPVAAMVALALAAHAPHLSAALAVPGPDTGPPATPLVLLHALAMLGFTAAAIWEVTRGWRDDLVEPRRAARRWVALGIGGYAMVVLVVELALRGRPVGMLLPALHVAGIGSVALALALLVAMRSLDAILGPPAVDTPSPPAEATPPAAGAPAAPGAAALPAPAPQVDLVAAQPAPPPPRVARALALLTQAMTEQRLYRREGLSLAALAAELGLGEAALRGLINQQQGFRNFNDFLHHYRLQEATRRLADEDLPVLSIALDCGYGSIGPFNRAFKLRHGLTPTEYRARCRASGAMATNRPD